MKILVSGACGFIGGELIKDLKDLGHTIFGVDSISKFRETDISVHSFMDWEDIYDSNSYDILGDVDFAFILGANSSTRATKEELRKPNLLSTSALITQLNLKRIPVVFASSGAVYGSKFKNSKATINPLTEYGRSKEMMERWISYFPLGDVVCLRYHNVYGATESHKGNMASIVSKWIDNYFDSVKTNDLFYGSDEIKRDFIHVEDVNKVNIMFLDFYIKYKQLPDVSILDVGSGIATSFEKVAKEIVKHTKGTIQSIINPYDESNYQFYTKANIKGISDIHKWLYDKDYKPMSIKEGIKKTFTQKVKLNSK
jgi:ADP-L-glycero-D-manno-heptose 6-epimerase